MNPTCRQGFSDPMPFDPTAQMQWIDSQSEMIRDRAHSLQYAILSVVHECYLEFELPDGPLPEMPFPVIFGPCIALYVQRVENDERAILECNGVASEILGAALPRDCWSIIYARFHRRPEILFVSDGSRAMTEPSNLQLSTHQRIGLRNATAGAPLQVQILRPVPAFPGLLMTHRRTVNDSRGCFMVQAMDFGSLYNCTVGRHLTSRAMPGCSGETGSGVVSCASRMQLICLMVLQRVQKRV